MNCPVCNVELQISERQGIEIDYCPRCRGVWLDRGELDKLIERSATTSGYPPTRERREDERDYGDREESPRRKRRGGFLGELFDFDD